MKTPCKLILLLVGSVAPALTATARYRQGRLLEVAQQEEEARSLFSIQENITLSQARQFCSQRPECVSFGFESPQTRYPASCAKVFFYRYADWHTGSTVFLEDPAWHLWVNTTREIEVIPTEVQRVLRQLDSENCSAASSSSPRSLRHNTNDDPQQQNCVRLLDAIFHLVFPKDLKMVAALRLIPKMVELSGAGPHPNVRRAALNNLIVIADSPQTAPSLVTAGVYEEMVRIIQQRSPAAEWEDIPILALDVVSNIAMYRTANPLLQQKGAPAFLQTIMGNNTGFPALQSTLALLHLDAERELIHLSKETIQDLVQLLKSSIDGDVVHGILWDLIPGPLSAIQLLVQQRIQQDSTIDALLHAGLVEELLRVLEEKCLVASHIQAALEILQGLALLSQPAREMIFLAGHSIRETQNRLQEYQQPTKLVQQLTTTVNRPSFVSWSEEL